jgi:hypothetical protein
MNTRKLCSCILATGGMAAMLLGAVDPLEGSLLILLGSGLAVLGRFLGNETRGGLRYWVWVFILVAAGVAAMVALSAVGGIGGRSGHSLWWGVLILPYPIGWLMGVAGMISILVRFIRSRCQRTMA